MKIYLNFMDKILSQMVPPSHADNFFSLKSADLAVKIPLAFKKLGGG